MSAQAIEKLSILAVDDSPHMRRLIMTVLTEFGCRKLADAESAAAALNHLKLVPTDLMILDHQMPGMGGIEFAADLRRNPQSPCPAIPIIMLTGHAKPELVRSARDAGIDDFLIKPFAPGKLIERICAVMSAPRVFIKNDTYAGPDRRRREDPGFSGPDRRKPETVEVS